MKRKREEEDDEVNNEEDNNTTTNGSSQRKRQRLEDQQQQMGMNCPYLDTINRKVLDFDFEKLCSVTLLNVNVYACLVCGKYFQGKGSHTPAYTHSLDDDHHVFMNLHNCKIYCLPESYEILDQTLNDIKYNLNPTYTQETINKLDHNTTKMMGLNGEEYYPGYVGLNNLKVTDGLNVVIQALAHVIPLRNFFLNSDNIPPKSHSLVVFGELIRKMWKSNSFKGHVSPHEALQAISAASERKYRIGETTDPVQFLTWFLNYTNRELLSASKHKKNKNTIVSETFQGQVVVTSTQIATREDEQGNTVYLNMSQPVEKTMPFTMLTLDVPPAPLFRDEFENNILPQVPIYSILSKFDGKTETTTPLSAGVLDRKTYRITKLPEYLIFHVKRFSRNEFFKEKNSTIVNFPLTDLDLSEHVRSNNSSKYDLVANIIHQGNPDHGTFKVQLLHSASNKWFEIQDLDVQEILPQLVTVSETYILVYRRKEPSPQESAPQQQLQVAK